MQAAPAVTAVEQGAAVSDVQLPSAFDECFDDTTDAKCAHLWPTQRRGANSDERGFLVMYVWDWHKRHAYPGLFEANFRFFMSFGVLKDPRHKFVAVINGEAPLTGSVFSSFALPAFAMDNVAIIRRPNSCFQYGSYGDALGAIAAHPTWGIERRGGLWRTFSHLVLLAASVRGPFVPPALRLRFPWVELFTAPLSRGRSGPQVVGPTINCMIFPHVQGIAQGMTWRVARFLRHRTTTFTCKPDQGKDINDGEVGVTRFIVTAASASGGVVGADGSGGGTGGEGVREDESLWRPSITALQWAYAGFNWSGMHYPPFHGTRQSCTDQWIGDPNDRLAHPFEAMFVKTEKMLNPPIPPRRLNEQEVELASEVMYAQDRLDEQNSHVASLRPYVGAVTIEPADRVVWETRTPAHLFTWTVLGWVYADGHSSAP